MKPVVKVSLRNGVLAGITASFLLAALYFIGRHPFLIPPYLDFRIILFGLFIYFTLREIRDYYQNGILYFWQGIIGSFLFMVSYAIASSLLLLLLLRIAPDFLNDYIRLSVEQLKSLPSEVVERIGNEMYTRQLEQLPRTGPLELVGLYFRQTVIISLFISIILSVILRRQPKT
jgi:hypothetical protein